MPVCETVRIELLTASGCGRCTQTRYRLRRAIAAFDDARVELHEVDVVDEIDYAVSLGVLTTPAIAINGELIFSGTPTEDQLLKAIVERLA